jgi:hypothetical protein
VAAGTPGNGIDWGDGGDRRRIIAAVVLLIGGGNRALRQRSRLPPYVM